MRKRSKYRCTCHSLAVIARSPQLDEVVTNRQWRLMVKCRKLEKQMRKRSKYRYACSSLAVIAMLPLMADVISL